MKVGVSYHRFSRCPAFCIGVAFALCNDYSKEHIKIGLVFPLIAIIIALLGLHISFFKSYLLTVLFFLIMYVIPNFNGSKVVKFFSSISLYMFIIQFLPIYVGIDILHLNSPLMMVFFVISIDIILALLLKKGVEWVNRIWVK